MKNFGAYIAFSVLVLYMGRELIGWMWWRWEDDEDEPFPAPLLWASWPVFCALDGVTSRIRRRVSGLYNILRKLLKRRQARQTPWEGPVDADGRTLEEWLAIGVFGVWDLRHWYDGEYDWEVRRRWEAYLSRRESTEGVRTAPSEGESLHR